MSPPRKTGPGLIPCRAAITNAAFMTNNDALRSLRYILDISDSEMAALFELGGSFVEPKDVKQMLLIEIPFCVRMGGGAESALCVNRGRDN
jgi:Protein of unknown function (DUF1456)